MNLMKLFNFSYLKENLKKSKVTLAFVLLILPILNLVIFLMSGLGDNVSVFSLNGISILTVFGMYILPIILSIILFSYVFKKKSVDFMGSMPIDRKAIFFTNTLGGIIIIILLLFITALLMMVASFILPNVYVPLGAFIDYLTIFIISYIFVFTACNIGVSVSGNIPTTLVVTALILFFVPYHHFMYERVLTNGNYTYYQLNYECSDCDLKDSIDATDDTYYTHLEKIEDKVSYTMPFEMMSQVLEYDEEGVEYHTSTIGKMALLSLLYILVGYILFEKREMEVCETSFKKFKTHQIVKFLTLVPILVVTSKILESASLIALIFVICLLLIYNFVYDLITRHSIIKIKSNLISFALVFVGITSICLVIINNGPQTVNKDFILSDIDNIQIELNTFSYYSDGQLVSIKDEVLKEKIIEGLFFSYMTSYEEQKDMYHVEVQLAIGEEKYESMSLVEKEVYENIQNYVRSTNVYKSNTLKEVVEANEIITLGNDYITLDEKGIEILETLADNNTESSSDFYIPISIYLYKNHKLKEYTINSDINSNLHEYIVNLYNKKAKEVDFSEVYSFNIVNESSMNGSYHLDGTVSVKTRIKQIMNQKIDFTKDVYKISIYRNGSVLYYYANLDEEFFDKIDSHSTYEDDVYYGY